MKCEKCGYINSDFDIICNECGSPLNIDKNIELLKKYNQKQVAIDIDEIRPEITDNEFNNTKKKVKFTIIFVFVLLCILLFIFIGILIKEVRTNDVLIQYDEFMDSNDSGIIYIGRDDGVNKLLKSYSKDYEINYLYISTNKITAIKKNKIKNSLKLNKINSTLVIINDGKVIDYLHEIKYEELNELNTFLQNAEIIPKEIGEPQEVISKFDEVLKMQEPVIVYIANNRHELNDEHHQKISDFCNDYSINYTFIEGYYLTDNQKLRILEKLNYSEIHDELIVLIDEGTVKEVSEKVSGDSRDYFELASNYGIIDVSSAESLENINFNKLKTLVSSKDKNIIMLGSNNCTYCDRLKPIIGKIGIQNNIKIYYFDIPDKELNSVEEYLETLGYKEGKITPPLIIITENTKLLDYIIGLSDKSLYEDKFKEFGVMR